MKLHKELKFVVETEGFTNVAGKFTINYFPFGESEIVSVGVLDENIDQYNGADTLYDLCDMVYFDYRQLESLKSRDFTLGQKIMDEYIPFPSEEVDDAFGTMLFKALKNLFTKDYIQNYKMGEDHAYLFSFEFFITDKDIEVVKQEVKTIK